MLVLAAHSAASGSGTPAGHLQARPQRRWWRAVASESRTGTDGPSQKYGPCPCFQSTVLGGKDTREQPDARPHRCPLCSSPETQTQARRGQLIPGPWAFLKAQLRNMCIGARKTGHCGGHQSGLYVSHVHTQTHVHPHTHMYTHTRTPTHTHVYPREWGALRGLQGCGHLPGLHLLPALRTQAVAGVVKGK